MKEKLVIGAIGVITCILILVTLNDVIWSNNSINKDNGEATTSVASNQSNDGTGDSADSEEDGESAEPSDGEDSSEPAGDGAVKAIINAEGMTLATRIAAPSGYTRTEEAEGSLGTFIRNYGLKENGAKVLLYDGNEKENQDAQAAVFTLPIEYRDLQQCADSVMRMYAEYFLATEQYDRIVFHYSDGFEASYMKWREGYKIKVTDGKASWVADSSCDSSYESFQEYMRMVFAYAGTYSMKSESTEISLSDIKIGDIFLKGGNPGHVVMVVDTCVDANGNKAFLLAQGFMPAQEFHVIKNPLHEDDPWYYVDEVVYPFVTPEYTFEEGTLRRLSY